MTEETALAPADGDDSAARFAANLAAFKERAPHLHSRLSRIERPHTDLLVGDDGSIDLALMGRRFYEGDAVAFAEAQMEAYFANPHRHRMGEPQPKALRGITADFIERAQTRMAAEGLVVDPDHMPDDGYFLTVFGVGLGLHVMPLMQRTGCRVMILVEPMLEALYQSLHVVDWTALFAAADAQGCRVTLVVEEDSVAVGQQVRDTVRRDNPALLDGLYFYRHYSTPLIDQALARFCEELVLTIRGLGFVEDEVLMMRNALANLMMPGAEVISRPADPRAEPLFIVGSGPSLMHEIDFIKENHDRAVVLSIGSALRALLSRDVKPDLHLELENTDNIAMAVCATADEFDVSGIALLTAATVQPALTQRFDPVGLFFREASSATLFFGQGFRNLSPTGPTVANAATVAALRLGFRELYFIGVDMGSKVEGQHHAEGTVFSTGVLEEYRYAEARLPGNLGGTSAGEVVLNWSRAMLESTLRAAPYAAVYNLSDGVRIRGATPRVSRAVELDGPPLDHQAIVAELRAQFSPYGPALLRKAWVPEVRRSGMSALFQSVVECLEAARDSDDTEFAWVDALLPILRPPGGMTEIELIFVRGSLMILSGVAGWYWRRLADAEARARYSRIAIEEVQAAVAEMRALVEALYDEMDEAVAAAG